MTVKDLQGLSLDPLATAFTTLISTNTHWHTFLTNHLELQINNPIPLLNTELHWTLPLETPQDRKSRLAEAEDRERKARLLKEKRVKDLAAAEALVKEQTKAVQEMQGKTPNKEQRLRQLDEEWGKKRKEAEDQIEKELEEMKKTKDKLAEHSQRLESLIDLTNE